jgi:YD repeat-containing protein
MVLAARISDAREVLLRRPGNGAVTAMTWDGDGRRVVFGSAGGECGVIDISA